MSLGVLNNLNAIHAENNLNNTSNSLSKVLNQLSSGSKINSGADDAAGLSLVDGLQANQQALTQSGTNASEGVGLLTVADGALSQVTNLLNRAVTLATEASNGTLNGSQDTAANQEYQSILSEISNIGSTTTYNQENVFGSKTDIYTGDSTTTGASVDSLNIRSLSSSNVGDSNGAMAYSNGTDNAFLNLSSGTKNAAVTDSLGTTLADSTTIAVNYMAKGADGSAVASSANITVGAGTTYANTAQGLISAINGSGLGLTASFGTAAQAGSAAVSAASAGQTTLGGGSTNTGIIISGQGIGTGTAATGANGAGEVGTLTFTDTSAANADAAKFTAGTLNITGSDGKSHAITLGTANSTDTLANLAATVNQAGYGVTATYNATDPITGLATTSANIVFTSANSAVTVSQTGMVSTASGGTAADTSLTGTPTLAGTEQTTTLGTVTNAGTNDILTFGPGGTDKYTEQGTAAADIAAINAGNFGVKATLVAGSTNQYTLTSNNSSMTATDSVGTNLAAAPAQDSTSSQYYSIGVSAGSSVYGGNTVNFITDSTTSGSTQNVNFVADNNGSGGTATISYSDSAGQSLSNTNLSTQSAAEQTLTALNTAITAVAAQDGYIGAQINTLNSVSSVLSTQSENVTAAQNAVQATDYATATSNMSKYQILSQTGISALAQANSMQQEVTKLLQ